MRILVETRRLELGRRSAVTAAAAACALALSAAPALGAAPGALDTTFGSNGIATVGAGTQLFGVAAESGGTTLVAGESAGRAIVDRLSTSGAVVGTWTGPSGYARAVAVTANGDVLVAGGTGTALFVERLTSALKPDVTFGLGGQALAFAGQTGEANAVAPTPSGGVIAAGSVGGNSSQAAAAGFSSHGAPQWSQVYSLGGNSVIDGLAVEPNGAAVIVGSQRATQIQYAVVGRLTGGGALDPSFRGDGAVTYAYPGSGLTAFNAAKVLSNGNILIAGTAAEGPTTLVARLTSAGQFDPSFGHGGLATAPAGENVSEQNYPIGAYGLGVAAGGAIIAAGSYENSGAEFDEALWAFTPNGAVDSRFGSGGTVRAPQGDYEACALGVLPDGNIVTVGDSTGLPDQSPCSVRTGSLGFAARYIGLGAVGVPNPVAFKATLTGLRGSYSGRAAAKKGITAKVGCTESCKIQLTVGASAAAAKALKISTRVRTCKTRNRKRTCTTRREYVSITVDRASGRLTSGMKTFSINSKEFKRAVVAFKRTKLRLRVTVTPSSGKKVVFNRTLTFHR